MVDPEISKQKFQQQVDLLQGLDEFIRKYGWQFETSYPDIYLTMHPSAHPETKFMVRLRCDDYAARSPSLQFVDPTTHQEGKQYWPQQGGAFQAASSRGPPPQLCIPGIREYHEGCHNSPSDPNPWNPEKYTLANILERVQWFIDDAYR
ncbi:MAG: hypothetical protein HY619_04085 [Thaumarchaeota archaeon]|nr:hypothetical protein [Nitrososphaerota archaeon]